MIRIKSRLTNHSVIKEVFINEYLLFNNNMIGKIIKIDYRGIHVYLNLNNNNEKTKIIIILLDQLIIHPLNDIRYKYNLRDLEVIGKYVPLKEKLKLI